MRLTGLRTRSCGLALLTMLAGCGASRAVAPMGAGVGAVTSSVGGPVLSFDGAPVPLPLVSVGYRRGLTDRTSAHGGVQLTNLVLMGVFGAELGVDVEVVPPRGPWPRLMVDQTVLVFMGDNVAGDPPFGARVFLDAGAVASWDVGRRQHHPYVGLRLFDQPFPEHHTYLSPVVGGVWNTGRVGWQAELGWPAFTRRNVPSFVDWIGPARHGALSVQLGATITLGHGFEP